MIYVILDEISHSIMCMLLCNLNVIWCDNDLFVSRLQELRKKLAQDKIKRAEQHEKNKDKAYDPMARFKFGG